MIGAIWSKSARVIVSYMYRLLGQLTGQNPNSETSMKRRPEKSAMEVGHAEHKTTINLIRFSVKWDLPTEVCLLVSLIYGTSTWLLLLRWIITSSIEVRGIRGKASHAQAIINRNIHTSAEPLEGQLQGTSLFTSAILEPCRKCYPTGKTNIIVIHSSIHSLILKTFIAPLLEPNQNFRSVSSPDTTGWKKT